jgi:hypothetical protein
LNFNKDGMVILNFLSAAANSSDGTQDLRISAIRSVVQDLLQVKEASTFG